MDALEAFDSESTSGSDAPEITPSSGAPELANSDAPELGNSDAPESTAPLLATPLGPCASLAALQTAGIKFDGNEGVAIAQALCRAFMTAELLRRIRPEMDGVSSPVTTETVFIDSSDRGVSANDPGNVQTAIQSIGRILSDILPANIRALLETTIIEKALASPPEFASVDELSRALTKYEEPNGRKFIRAVYERAEQLGVLTTPSATLHTPFTPERTPPPPIPDSNPSVRLRSGHPVGVVAFAVVAIIAVLGLGGWFLTIRQTTTDSENLPTLPARPIWLAGRVNIPPYKTLFPDVSDAGPYLQKQAAAGASITRSDAPLTLAEIRSLAGGEQPAGRPSGTARAEAVVAPRPSTARSEPTRSPDAVRRSTAPAPPSTPASRLRAGTHVDVTANSRTSGTPSNGAAIASDSPASPPRPADTETYDRDDPDVIPPAPVAPRLLASLQPSSPGVRLDALTIAVVVEPDGTAYSVAGVTLPQNMGEWVLLTAALEVVKGWRFTPAMKDGEAVRYRVIVPLRAVTSGWPPTAK